MALTLELPAPLERRLAAQAAVAGKTAEALAVELIEKALPRERTLAEIMAPFAAEVAARGITEEELDAIVEQARQEVWEEQQQKKRGGQ
jgi:predicted transcriptional regulator